MAIWKGNHFKRANENGKEVWRWEDKIGSQCGRDRKWRYEVQRGDVYRPDVGTCPSGDKWAEMDIFGQPIQEK